MLVLGLSAYYHDSAAALLRDGAIAAAAQEERFTRIKHDARFPSRAVRYCLQEAGVALDDVDAIVFYEKPFLKFERLLETYLATAPRGFRSFRAAMPIWTKQKLFQKRTLRKALEGLGGSRIESRLLFAEHHQSHAASAFFPSPFDEAVVVTMDGVGEWATTSVCVGQGNTLQTHKEIRFPHSLGLLYSAFTYYTGFKVNSGEYKVMGLAPYGEPKYAQRIRDHLIDVKPDGSFHVAQEYFDYATGLTMTNARFHDLFGGAPRRPESPLAQRDMDLAASVQAVTEDVVARLTTSAAKETGQRNLCLAGGVALNCVANGKLKRSRAFDGIWVQPAAGDAGGALGAAYAAWHQHYERPRRTSTGTDAMQGSFLGPAFDDEAIAGRIEGLGGVVQRLDDQGAIDCAADALAKGQAVGWFQGRMEFGPRALGARSIVADRAARPCRDLELEDQVPRELPSVRASRHVRRRGAVVRARRRESVHAAGGGRRRGTARWRPRRAGRQQGPRQAGRAALDHSGRHPRGLLRAGADRSQRDESPLPCAAGGLQGAHRLPGASSTPASTCAANPSSARPRTASAASWAPSSTCSSPATWRWSRPTRAPRCARTTRSASGRTERRCELYGEVPKDPGRCSRQPGVQDRGCIGFGRTRH